MYQEFLAYWQSRQSIALTQGISIPSLTVDLWHTFAYPFSALPYSFRHALQRIKRKTHERTRELARKSSCCVRPFRRVKKRAVSKGANTSLCMSLPDFIKRPLATDGCLFVGDFVKDFPVVDGPVVVAYSFLSVSERAPRPIYFRLCPYWSTEISFRLRVISTGAK